MTRSEHVSVRGLEDCIALISEILLPTKIFQLVQGDVTTQPTKDNGGLVTRAYGFSDELITFLSEKIECDDTGILP